MFKKLALLALILLLPACTEVELASHVAKQIPITPETQQAGTFKVGSSYRIAGKKYTPKERYSFTQTGIASWYGPNFHGKQTANGEIFDKYALTAAHRTLQMPSIARVTNLENGRSIIVRVNDRGPFSKGRVLDLSERSAELLDFKHKGTAKIRIDVIEEESRNVAQLAKDGYGTQGYEVALNQNSRVIPTPQISAQPIAPVQIATASPTTASGFYVQAGSFGSHANAMALAQKLHPYGVANVRQASVNGSQFYRVSFGPFQSQPDAVNLVASLSQENIRAPILIVE